MLTKCNCSQRPSAIGEPAYWDRNFKFQGSAKHPEQFQPLDSNLLDVPLEFTQHLYACRACGQGWYVECTPEEQPDALFAMKYDGAVEPTRDAIDASKRSLCVLAHDGHDVALCRHAGCTYNRLKGRELCELHLSCF